MPHSGRPEKHRMNRDPQAVCTALVWYYQTQHLILMDMEKDGKVQKVIMQAPKNGFFYVLDRRDGKLLSAEPYTYINWATAVDKTTGRPIESSFSRYRNENVRISPGPYGGHNWQPMAYNRMTNLVYIPVSINASTYGPEVNWKYKERGVNTAARSDLNIPTREKQVTRTDRAIFWAAEILLQA